MLGYDAIFSAYVIGPGCTAHCVTGYADAASTVNINGACPAAYITVSRIAQSRHGVNHVVFYPASSCGIQCVWQNSALNGSRCNRSLSTDGINGDVIYSLDQVITNNPVTDIAVDSDAFAGAGSHIVQVILIYGDPLDARRLIGSASQYHDAVCT